MTFVADGTDTSLMQCITPKTAKPEIDVEDFTCVLCQDLFFEPLALSCGHTFCRLCLHKTLQRARKVCPVCRANCHVNCKTQQPNVILVNLIQKFFAAEYEARRAEIEQETQQLSHTHPIFFYNEFNFPGSVMGLCLFEPRYKIMIRRVIESDQKFIYLPSFNGYRAEEGQIGLLGTVTRCEFDDMGRANLEMSLRTRIVVQNSWVEQGTGNLHFCEYRMLEDEPSQASEDSASLVQSVFTTITTQMTNHNRSLPVDSPSVENLDQVIWWIAEMIKGNLPRAVKHQMMSSTKLSQRCDLISQLLRQFTDDEPEETCI